MCPCPGLLLRFPSRAFFLFPVFFVKVKKLIVVLKSKTVADAMTGERAGVGEGVGEGEGEGEGEGVGGVMR